MQDGAISSVISLMKTHDLEAERANASNLDVPSVSASANEIPVSSAS